MNKKSTEQFSPALREMDRRTPIPRNAKTPARSNGAGRRTETTQLVTRRTAIGRISAGVLLSLGLWPGALRAAENGGGRSFRFVVVNDTHCQSAECGEYLHKLALQMKQERPEFVLNAGDVTDKGDKKSFGLIEEAFDALGCPWYPVIGNHDYATQTDRRAYTQAFPLRINYYFKENGWQFVGLDSSDGLRYEKTAIQAATFEWLNDYLSRLDKSKPTVVFTHFPMGEGVKYRPSNADAVLERFLDFNLQAVFCGHYHAFTEKLARDVPITTNKCCALKRNNHDNTKEKGYFVCDVSEGGLTRRFVEFKPA